MSPDETPHIQIAPAELPRMIAQAIGALQADPTLYVRGNPPKLVTITREPRRIGRAPSPQIAQIEWSTLSERLATFATWSRLVRNVDGSFAKVPAAPDRSVISMLLAKPEKEWARPLDGITEAPFLRCDGTICQTPGYDGPSATLYEPNAPFLPIADAPTHEDACRALAELREPFREFPFRAGPDRDVPIGALLTVLGRRAIEGPVPAFCFDATGKASGKSLIAKVVYRIATGASMPPLTWPKSDEEVEKMLGAEALSGNSPIVGFDDISIPIEGGPLNKMLTVEERTKMRILGKSETPVLPWLSVLFFTGNNLSVRGDTQRRALITRLEPPTARPELRTFDRERLLQWVASERLRLLSAGLTLLRAYVVAGRPRVVPLLGTFESWAELVPNALAWAGGENLLGAFVTAQESHDPFRASVTTILDAWPKFLQTYPKLAEGEGLTLRDLQRTLYPEHETGPDGYDNFREALETLAPGKTGRVTFDRNHLGRILGQLRGQWQEAIEEWAGARRFESKGSRTGVLRWRVEEQEDPADAYHCNNVPPETV